jgi:hypothetical protein
MPTMKKPVARPPVVAPTSDSYDEDDVRRGIASGQMVRHVSGSTPVDEVMVAKLRAQIAARSHGAQAARDGGRRKS